jgi:DMSO/TMAO reductase YedYZ heme-binding membrane subunit
MAALDLSGPTLWYATRSAGVVALVLLTISLAMGVLTAGKFQTRRSPRFLVVGLHRNASLLAVVFLGIHVATTIADSYTSISWRDAVLPFGGPYRPFWLGLGAVASDLLILLTVTSLARSWLGYRAWRVIHWLSYGCWPSAVVHGLGTGHDAQVGWVRELTFGCVAVVAGAIAWRLWPGWSHRGGEFG